MSARIISTGPGLRKRLSEIARGLDKAAKVRIGFLENATYPDGKPVAMIAAIQEFGAPARNIPPRPFFRQMIAAKSSGMAAGNCRSRGLDRLRCSRDARTDRRGDCRPAPGKHHQSNGATTGPGNSCAQGQRKAACGYRPYAGFGGLRGRMNGLVADAPDHRWSSHNGPRTDLGTPDCERVR